MIECHFQDFVTKIVIYIFLDVSLHYLLGLNALMKYASKLGTKGGHWSTIS